EPARPRAQRPARALLGDGVAEVLPQLGFVRAREGGRARCPGGPAPPESRERAPERAALVPSSVSITRRVPPASAFPSAPSKPPWSSSVKRGLPFMPTFPV